MSRNPGYISGSQQRNRIGALAGDAVDGIHHHLHHRQVEREGWISEQGILQMVFRAVYLARHHIAQHHVVLRQPVCLAYRKRLAVFPAQHPAQEGAVHILVLLGKHGTRGTIECHSSTFFIQQGSLADGRFRTVKGHDVAGCRHPQRQVFVSERFEIRDLEHVFMRNLGFASMSGIIHHQGTISLLLPDDTGDFGIGISR